MALLVVLAVVLMSCLRSFVDKVTVSVLATSTSVFDIEEYDGPST